MRKYVVFILCIAVAGSGFAQSWNQENVVRIQKSLDAIILDAQNLPPNVRDSIAAKVQEIRQILAWMPQPYPQPQPSPQPQPRPDGWRTYNDGEMRDIVKRVKDAWPARDQKALIQRIGSTSRFRMKQIKEIVAVLDFSSDKKEVLGMLLPKVLDPENVDVLFDVFWTSSDKEYIYGLLPR